jgi:hypothetical protein
LGTWFKTATVFIPSSWCSFIHDPATDNNTL